MDVLVLTCAYEPQQIVTWERAITLWYDGKVDIIESYPDRVLRGARLTMQMPAVVVFKKQSAPRKRVVRFSREAIYIRDGGKCAYCRQTVAKAEITYDHVLPRRLGGKTHWENIVIACGDCNSRKGGRTPEQAGMRLAVHPHKPKSLPLSLDRVTWRQSMPDLWKPYMIQEVSYG